jgi:hypothetical protein
MLVIFGYLETSRFFGDDSDFTVEELLKIKKIKMVDFLARNKTRSESVYKIKHTMTMMYKGDTPTLRTMLCIILLLKSALGSSGNNQNYNGNNNGQYGNGNYGLQFSKCEDSVVEVTYLAISCDSPYTFYYGNGANRDSVTCDYGDKATISGTVNVMDNLQYGDRIYITMAISDNNNNMLMTSGPIDFCENLITYECAFKGTYNFQTKMKLTAPESGNQTKFYPYIQMAFSTLPDSGYNLGAVNVNCRNQENPTYVSWVDNPRQRSRLEDFAADNGMLIGACVLLALFSGFVWNRAGEEDEIDRRLNSQEAGLMSLD